MPLSFESIEVAYGAIGAVNGISGTVPDGRIVGILGANGAGKTSLVDAIIGRVPYKGTVTGPRGPLDGLPTWRRLRQGIGVVPQERELLPELTVEENIRIATAGLDRRETTQGVTTTYDVFPRLAELRSRKVGHLSGGERQLTAIGRALVRKPSVLILDEPSLGLSPAMRETVVASLLQRCHSDGLAVLLVEQFHDLVLRFADEVLVVANGAVEWSGPISELNDATVQAAYLGETGTATASPASPAATTDQP